MCSGSLFGRHAASFDGVQPFQELAGEDQSALPGGIGHRASRSRELLTRPAAKIAFIRFHVPLHEPATHPSRNQEFTLSYPQVESGSATERNASQGRRGKEPLEASPRRRRRELPRGAIILAHAGRDRPRSRGGEWLAPRPGGRL